MASPYSRLSIPADPKQIQEARDSMSKAENKLLHWDAYAERKQYKHEKKMNAKYIHLTCKVRDLSEFIEDLEMW